MNSLEWRVKQLERRILGQGPPRQDPIIDQLETVAKLCRSYPRFFELYDKYKEDIYGAQVGATSKVELILAYEEDLINYMQDLKVLVEKADKVLNIDNWPDLSKCDLRQLKKITREQHLQATEIDKKTEDLIDIYNDIICSFKKNIGVWDKKLEAYENEDRKLDD